MSKCLTAAQKKGRRMRARGRTYRGGYTRAQIREIKEGKRKMGE